MAFVTPKGFIPDWVVKGGKGGHRIQKWYYMNLDERVDKHYAQQINSMLHGVPVQVLERFPVAIENDVCPDDIPTLAQMIVDDGFPEWECYVKEDFWRERKIFGPHFLAADWTKLRALRQMIEREENAVLCSDAAFLSVDFAFLQHWINQIPHDLRVLNLYWWYDDEDPKHARQAQKMQPTSVVGIYNNFALFGAAAVFFTWEGAKAHLELWRKYRRVAAEPFPFYAGGDDMDQLAGYYACNPTPMRIIYPGMNGYSIATRDKVLSNNPKGEHNE